MNEPFDILPYLYKNFKKEVIAGFTKLLAESEECVFEINVLVFMYLMYVGSDLVSNIFLVTTTEYLNVYMRFHNEPVMYVAVMFIMYYINTAEN